MGAVIIWRDFEWWAWGQALGLLGLQQSPWRHNRPGPHVRWEGVVVQIVGPRWKVAAVLETWGGKLG